MEEPVKQTKSNFYILAEGDFRLFCTPTHYPISTLLYEIATGFGSSPIEVATKLELHPRRISAKRLNRWIGEAEGHSGFLENFGKATAQTERIQAALEESDLLKEEEKEAAYWAEAEANRPRFKPFIELVTDRLFPKQIFAEILTAGRFKRVPWEVKEGESVEDARLRAGAVCRAHYKESGGTATNWGDIRSYLFVEAWNRHVTMSIEGEVLEVIERPYLPAIGTLSV